MEAETIGQPLQESGGRNPAAEAGYWPGRDSRLRDVQEEERQKVEDHEAKQAERKRSQEAFVSWGFNAYFLACFVILLVPILAVVVLMSDMGCGLEFSRWVRGLEVVSRCFAGVLAVLFACLYLMDFFWPPHLPAGMYCTFSAHDRTGGNIIMALLTVLLFGAAFFSAKEYPQMPILVTVVSAPVLVMGIRLMHSPPRTGAKADSIDKTERAELMKFLRDQSDDDCRTFCAGAMAAFFTLGGGTILAWICWVLEAERNAVEGAEADGEEGLRFLTEVAPFCAGFGYMLFGAIAMLRVKFEDPLRADLLKERKEAPEEASEESIELAKLDKRLKEVVWTLLESEPGFDLEKYKTEEQKDKLVWQHVHDLQLLSHNIKYIGCGLITFIGFLYISFELVAADSPAAQLMLGVVGAFGLFFMAFLFIGLPRFTSVMREWCKVLPLFKTAQDVAQNDWVRAMLLCATLFAAPYFLVLSMVNQRIRRHRKLYDKKSGRRPRVTERTSSSSALKEAVRNSVTDQGQKEIETKPEDHWCTERVADRLQEISKWDKISVVRKMHVLCLLFMCYVLSPRLLNIFLAWLSSMLAGLPYSLVLVLTAVSGIGCFLLPPVPGVPVYLFTGVLAVGESPFDFWPSCCIGIAVGYCLKLTACALQQKLIGQRLGNMLWVRSACGVNKPLIRAIELVLSEPGTWTVGKVSILCGGPDWPTSVLAGILKLPLHKMELGTLPVILFIMPCTLSGACYLRREESEFWSRAATLMISSTVLMGLGMWVSAAWAIQEKLEKEYLAVTRPLEANIDLDWLDYRNEEIAKSCPVSWSFKKNHKQPPACAKVTAVGGLLMALSVCHLFYWKSASCFGEFAVTDDIGTLVILKGDEGVIKPLGLVALAVAAVGLSGYFALAFAISSLQKDAFKKKADALDETKEKWLEDHRERQKDNCPPKHSSSTVRRATVYSAVTLGLQRTTAGDLESRASKLEAKAHPAPPTQDTE